MPTKKLKCSCCLKDKPLQQFAIRSGTLNCGRQYWCLDCMKTYAKRRRTVLALSKPVGGRLGIAQ